MHQFVDIYQYKIPIVILVLGSVCILVSLIAISKSSNTSEPEDHISFVEKEPIENDTFGTVIVDIQGAVQDPGIYEFDSDTRVGEAIDEIGGFHNDADITWIAQQLNQASIVTDGMKLYIPFDGENSIPYTNITSDAGSGLININTSSQSELESLPGVGEITATKIISARPFTSIEELLELKIVGEKTYEKIQKSITTASQ